MILLSGAIFLRRTICGEEGKYADFRHRGVGASLLKAITAEDTYRSLLGMLITEEAEQFYEPFGFRKDPICFMTRKETPEAITNE